MSTYRLLSRALITVAALILLALAAACGEPPSSTTAQAQATSPLEPVSPSGDVQGAVTFSWHGTSANRVVHIYVVDAAERTVTDFEARGTSAEAPQIVLDAIRPGEAMGWRVAEIDDNGEPARLSRLMRFTWRP